MKRFGLAILILWAMSEVVLILSEELFKIARDLYKELSNR